MIKLLATIGTAGALLFGANATSTDVGGQYARTIIGTPSTMQNSASFNNGLLDPLNVARINTGDWFNLECKSDSSTATALTTAFLRAATNTPIIETSVVTVPETSNTASSSVYFIGFMSITGAAAEYTTYGSGCYFSASTTKNNWQAMCNNGGTMTIQDTGVASTSAPSNPGTTTKMRVEMNGSTARFFIATSSNNAFIQTNIITTNIPTTTSLTPLVSVGHIGAGTTGGVSPEPWVRYIRMWYRDPEWQ